MWFLLPNPCDTVDDSATSIVKCVDRSGALLLN